MRTLTLRTTTAFLLAGALAACSGDATDSEPLANQPFDGVLAPSTPGESNQAPEPAGETDSLPNNSELEVGDGEPVTSLEDSQQQAIDSQVGDANSDTTALPEMDGSESLPMDDSDEDDLPMDDPDEDEPQDSPEQPEPPVMPPPEPEPPVVPLPEPEPEPEPVQLDVPFSELYSTIFVATCAGGNCHGTTAPRAPFGADDEQFAYEVIMSNAPRILDRLQGINGGIMPRGCGNGIGNNRCLTQEQFDNVQAWVDAGMPR